MLHEGVNLCDQFLDAAKEPRRIARWVMSPNQRSTWFNHEE